MRASRALALLLLVLGMSLLPVRAVGAGVAREDTPGEAPSVSLFAARPTTVLLSVPLLDTTAALSASDPSYSRLRGLLATERAEVRSRRPAQGALGPTAVVTWMANEVQVWRVDRIYYATSGGPWISTEVLRRGVDPEARSGWHRSDDPKRLLRTLRDLGLVGVDEDATPAAQSMPPAAAVDPGVPDWRWGAGGLVMGGLVVGLVRMLARQRTVGRSAGS